MFARKKSELYNAAYIIEPIYIQSGQNRPGNFENIVLTKVFSGRYLK